MILKWLALSIELFLYQMIYMYINFQVSGHTDAGIQVCPKNASVLVQCHLTTSTVGKMLTDNSTDKNSKFYSLGLQTIVAPKKDVSTQCSLLPAPPLSLIGKHDFQPEVENLTDVETDEVSTEVDGSDTDYMTDSVVER